ncbi:MAG: carbohydrate ABC transporter permease [Anaerolineales bacterium]|nr:carbohydrate ABC transporter permease [Anaerolineales bacterium]
MKKKITVGTLAFNLAIFSFLIVQMYPLFWLIVSSFRPNLDLSSKPFSFPSTLTIVNFQNVILKSNIFIYIKNTVIVAIVSLFLIVVISSMASFAISKMRFGLSDRVYSYFITGLTIPYMVTVIPLFIMFTSLNIIDSYLALILPMVGFSLPVSILLFVNFFRFIPNELIEAAIIDGCSITQVFTKIILPLSRNTIVTVIAMNLIFIWNDYTFSLIFINSTEMKTVSLGLQDFIGSHGVTDWGATYAAICTSTLPTLILYFLLHKQITGGMTLGAVKG